MSRLHDVADPAHRVDQLGVAPVVELLAQPCDHDVHDVRAGVEMVVPGVLRDQGPRHDAALVAHQVFEHGVFFGGELDDLPASPYLAASAVALHVLSDGLVVFDDEDVHPVGRYTRKFDPTPTCDSTSIRPRCSAMMP